MNERGATGDGGARAGARRKRAPRRITRSYLENAALAYLGRFAATAASLERVLMRRVRVSAHHHGTDPAEGAKLVADLIARYREAGLIDDAAFAAARARRLHGRGVALRAITQRLRAKGVSAADAEAAVAALGQEAGADADGNGREALDAAAARAYARRRRLGPWGKEAMRAERRERDLAALARAGFSYAVARAVIDGKG